MITVLISESRALLAWAPTAAALPAAPANSSVRELAAWDAPPPEPYRWSPEALDWTIPAPSRLVWTRLEFRWRYTALEQAAIRRATRSHPDEDVMDMLGVLADSLAEATEIDPRDPRTVQGVKYHAAVGLIQPSRVAEILGYDPDA